MWAMQRDPHAGARRAETLGLLLIALAVLTVILSRWGGALRWGLR